ncbi:hypothetical protein BC827DRAFT_1157245 [Russula dissimulans]|nr:hypothetical protein BC827DRAFT_1157245 [Russula dissimulans]
MSVSKRWLGLYSLRSRKAINIGKRDSIREIGMDRREVNREEWVVDVLAFHVAQAIVGENGFVGGGEGVVAGRGECCLCALTCRLVLVRVGAPTSWFRAQLRGGHPSTHFLSPISRSHSSAASKNAFCFVFSLLIGRNLDDRVISGPLAMNAPLMTELFGERGKSPRFAGFVLRQVDLVIAILRVSTNLANADKCPRTETARHGVMTMIPRGQPIKRDEKTKESYNQAFQQSYHELGAFVFAHRKNNNKKGGTWILTLNEVSPPLKTLILKGMHPAFVKVDVPVADLISGKALCSESNLQAFLLIAVNIQIRYAKKNSTAEDEGHDRFDDRYIEGRYVGRGKVLLITTTCLGR